MESEKKARRDDRAFRQAVVLAIIGVAVGGVVFGPGMLAGAAETGPAVVLAFVFGVSAMLALMRRAGMIAWLVGTYAGYLVGLADAFRLAQLPDVPGAYGIALVTALVFTVLGFIGGMVAEFIRFLHTLSHGLRRDKAEGERTKGEWSATTTN